MIPNRNKPGFQLENNPKEITLGDSEVFATRFPRLSIATYQVKGKLEVTGLI